MEMSSANKADGAISQEKLIRPPRNIDKEPFRQQSHDEDLPQ